MSPAPSGKSLIVQRDPKNAYVKMDALRALVAMAVAVSHIRNIMMQDYGGQSGLAKPFYFLTGFGHAGVVMFFVLSGFWITKTVIRRARDHRFWYEYMVDRLTRLWVVVLPALVFGGVLDFIGSKVLRAPLYNGTGGAESLMGAIDLSLTAFLANMVFVQNMLAPVFGSNGPLWSLAFEFWYYLWFPAIWFVVRYRRATPMLGTLLLGFLFPELAVGFLSWLCGAALLGVVRHWSGVAEGRGVAVPIVGVGSLALAAALIVIRLHPYSWMDPILALAFSLFLLAICIANTKTRGLGMLSRFGAKASFSLYAIHYPIAALAAAITAPAGRLAYSIETVCLVLAVLALSIVVAAMFGACTEAHTGRIRQWFGAPRHLSA